MTTPLPDTRKQMLRSVADVDLALRIALVQAARDAEKTVRRIKRGVGSEVSEAQILRVFVELRALAHELWGNEIPGIVARMIAYAEFRSSQGPDALDRVMAKRASNPKLLEAMQAAQRARARRVVQVLRTREQSARFELSSKVWKWEFWHNGQVERRLSAAFARGASAREIASMVRHMVDPDTPGGPSYAAMRLGRTEVANAFHAQTIADYKDNPFVPGLKWNLSGSHPHEDPCDELAKEHSRGLAPGVYRVLEVPDKPHPQCMCNVSPETMKERQFHRGYERGDFNAYLLGKYPDLDPAGLPPF